MGIYSDKTYEKIKESVLNEISNNLDKREGSFINDMVSPYCMELEAVYEEFPFLLGTMFLVDADSNELEKRAAEYGLTRKNEVKATGYINIIGKAGTTLKEGTLISTETGIQFVLNKNIILSGNEDTVEITAANAGSVYNLAPDTITKFVVPTTGITITNKNKTQGGADKETDEELLKRILNKIQNPSTGGNIHDYKNWTMETEGVTDCKIYPLFYGNGTVRILALGIDKKPLDDVTLKRVIDNIEKKKPVFGKITVETPKVIPININAEIKTENNFYSAEYVKVEYAKLLKKYIEESVFKRYVVDYYKAISIFYDIPGISEVSNVTVNGGKESIKINDDSIQAIGNIEIKLI